MWILPMSLRARLAAMALLGIFFIPFATSDLRGLSHVLTCSDEVEATLYVGRESDEDPVLGSADTFDRDNVDGFGLCGGLTVDLGLRSTTGNRAVVTVSVHNETEHDWQGTIELVFDGAPVPVAVGRISAGGTDGDEVEVRIGSDSDYEISGTLLIGP